jgi:signal transduction histidine kinase
MVLKNRLHSRKKPRKLRRLFSGYIAAFCIGTILLAGLMLAGSFALMSIGIILPANYAELQLSSAKERIESSDTVTPDMIPETCSYGVFTPQGKFVSGNLSKEDAATAWNVTQVKGYRQSSGYFYFSIPRKNEICIVRYMLFMQFSSPLLRRLLPPAELLTYPLFGILFLLEVFLLASSFGKKLAKKLQSLQNAAEKIQNQDLNFTVESSGITEIDNVLNSIDKMKEALKKSLQEQWELQQSRREEISALAHDIKTPITVVRGNADLLSETDQTEEQKNYTGYIVDSTSQMEQYIKTLIEISKAETGYSVNKRRLDTEAFITEIHNQISALTAPKRLSLRFETHNLPQSFCADPELLQRAIINIVSNAVDFSEENGTVLFRVDNQENRIQFCSIDSGKGFSSDALKNAANQFYMSDRSRTSKTHYGMGLFIAKSIAVQHSGTLLIENSPETGGGKVTIQIPAEC